MGIGENGKIDSMGSKDEVLPNLLKNKVATKECRKSGFNKGEDKEC